MTTDARTNRVIVVTPHSVTYDWIRDHYLHDRDHKWLEKVTIDDVFGREVWGTLPLHLACHTKRLIVVPIIRPPQLLREPMTYEDIETFAREPVVYEISRVGEISTLNGDTQNAD